MKQAGDDCSPFLTVKLEVIKLSKGQFKTKKWGALCNCILNQATYTQQVKDTKNSQEFVKLGDKFSEEKSSY